NPTRGGRAMRKPMLLLLLAGWAAALTTGDAAAQSPDKVQLQLKWVTQAQFAGYYAAKAKGFYTAENLDVTIRPGGPDIVPEQVVAGGGAPVRVDPPPSPASAPAPPAPPVDHPQAF